MDVVVRKPDIACDLLQVLATFFSIFPDQNRSIIFIGETFNFYDPVLSCVIKVNSDVITCIKVQ